jgi:hypothetical protein
MIDCLELMDSVCFASGIGIAAFLLASFVFWRLLGHVE